MTAFVFGRRLLSLATLAIATPLAAQSGAITGTVKDSASGMPIGAATVVAVNATGGIGGNAITNATGTFRIANLANGTYTVQTLSIGHAPKSITGVVVSGQAVTVTILMTKPNMLEEVVVTMTRGTAEKVLDSPGSISVVNTEAIATRPSVTTSDHLKETPGIDVSQGGIAQSNVVARGFNNAFSGALLTLQDYRFAGVPSLRVNVPLLFTGSNEDIERIEVLLGPASALYGPNSANGVLHIITKSPFTSQGTTFTLDGGEQSIMRASVRHATVLGENVGVKLSGEYLRGKDFIYHDPGEPATFPSSAPAGRAGLANNRDFNVAKYTFEGRVDWRLDNRTEAVTTVGYTDALGGIELTGANGAGFIKNWSYANVQERFRRGRFFAQAFALFNNSGNSDSAGLDGTYLLRTGQPIVDQSRVYAGQLQHSINLAGSRFIYGADYVYTNPRTAHTINGANEDIDNVTEWGAYIQGLTPLVDKWDFISALRVDHNSAVDGYQFSPRAALEYRPSPTQNFTASYNRAFSTPANFSYFLDLVSQRNAGGSGFDVRAVGNNGGHGFDRSCSGAGFGSFCMRSIYTPGALVPASAGSAFQGLITAQSPALNASITAGLAAAGVPNAAALAAAIVNGLRATAPTNAQLATRAAYLISATSNLNPDSILDIGELKAGYNNNFELDYKGIIGKRGRFSADVWYQQRGEVNPPAFVATPSVFFVPSGVPNSLGAYLGGNIAATVTAALMALGLPQAQAQAQAAQIAGALAPSLTAALAPAPLGTVTFTDQNRPDVLATYASVSGKQLDVWGIDIGYDYLLTDAWTLSGTYSWMCGGKISKASLRPSCTIFPEIQGGNALPYMSNSPANKGSVALRYRNDAHGYGVEVRGRYTDAFPVNSGVYYSNKDIPAPGGATAGGEYHICAGGTTALCYQYPGVPVIMTLDLGFRMRVPVGAKNVMWSLNGTNVLDNKRATFDGTPAIGRLVMTRLSYTF